MTAVDLHPQPTGRHHVEPLTSSELIARRFEDYITGQPVPYRLAAILTVYEAFDVYRFDSTRPVRLLEGGPGLARSIDLDAVRAGHVTLAEAITAPALDLHAMAWNTWGAAPKVWDVSLVFVFPSKVAP